MKTLSILLAALTLATGAFAQMGHGISKHAKHVTTCPVTGDKVDIDQAKKAKLFADYKGHRYYFCCNSCPGMFKRNPAKYAKKSHVKPPAHHHGGH